MSCCTTCAPSCCGNQPDNFIGQSNLPRGLRNNNPTNIVDDGTMWLGKTGNDGRFITFKNVAYGIRAYIINFFASVNKHGCSTLDLYINRFAPPSENDTASYLATVVNDTGISADAPIPTDQASISSILRAQLNVELGAKYAPLVTDADIADGFALYNNPASTFISSISTTVASYPAESYTIMGITAIGLSALGFGIYKLIANRKK